MTTKTRNNVEVVRPYRCEECGERLSLDTGVVAFVPWEEAGATICHEECARPLAYQAAFDRLVRNGMDGPNGWATHLCRKQWWTTDYAWVLDCGYRMALDLKRRAAEAPPRESPAAVMRPVAASIPRRRPRTPDNPRNITAGTRARVLERDGFRCRRCGNGPDASPLVIDHIQPVAKGGTAALENLQTLCQPCNAGKRDRDPTPHDLGART